MPKTVAAGSFKTLAKALAAADLVGTLKGPGPFTVFAPTDEAFEKLPAGTLDNLLKPENKAMLVRVLTYHVLPGRVMAADVVKVSTDDLDFIAPDDRAGGVAGLLDGGVSVVLHTDGGRAVHIHWKGKDIEVAVPTVELVDTIGAGDAFGGAFAAWWDQAGLGRGELLDRDRVRCAVAAAVEVAAISCTRVGAQPPRRAELGAAWSPRR